MGFEPLMPGLLSPYLTSNTTNILVLTEKKVTNSCYWILIPHYNWMSGIWKSDSSQKNKGKALTGWKIAEFACFFVSDLLLFTACKPQLSIEWQVSKVANIFWHIVTAQAIWFYYAFSPSSIFPLGKNFAFWRWPADRMPITFVYAQWSIILASHANSTISLWFFHSDSFLFIIT